jgi:hypothetical protein
VKNLVKNIDYKGAPIPSKMAGFILDLAQKAGGSSSVIEGISKTHYALNGSQMRVDQDVSADLLLTDMSSVRLEEIPFPAKSIEFFFEDPELPTILVVRGKLLDILRECKFGDMLAPPYPEGYEEESINFYTESSDGVGFAFRARAHNWNEMIAADQEEIEDLKGSVAFTNTEWEYLRVMFNLCVKVLAYASIPHFAPRPINRKQMRHGKPGVKGRPVRPSMRVVYLPEVSRENEPGQASHGDSKKKFLGRRGHMRYYRSPRYKHMRGKFQYIPPVLGPNGETPKALYKVRKPSTYARPASRHYGHQSQPTGNNATTAITA